MGWATEVSLQTQDQSVNVLAKRDIPYDRVVAIQAKRHGEGTTIGSPAIQQYASLRHQDVDADQVVVVTSGKFSGQAVDLADQLDVKLVNGGDLVDTLRKSNAEFTLADYHTDIETPEPEYDDLTTDRLVTESEDVIELPHVHYTWIVGIGTLAGALMWPLVGLTSGEGAITETSMVFLALIGTIFCPFGIYMDHRQTSQYYDFGESKWWYLAGSLTIVLSFVFGLLYLTRKYLILKDVFEVALSDIVFE